MCPCYQVLKSSISSHVGRLECDDNKFYSFSFEANIKKNNSFLIASLVDLATTYNKNGRNVFVLFIKVSLNLAC